MSNIYVTFRARRDDGKIPARSSSTMADGQLLKIRTALDALEHEGLAGAFDIGTISIACALGYLDLRFAAESWRTRRPRLAAWLAAVSPRPSLAATIPAAT